MFGLSLRTQWEALSPKCFMMPLMHFQSGWTWFVVSAERVCLFCLHLKTLHILESIGILNTNNIKSGNYTNSNIHNFLNRISPVNDPVWIRFRHRGYLFRNRGTVVWHPLSKQLLNGGLWRQENTLTSLVDNVKVDVLWRREDFPLRAESESELESALLTRFAHAKQGIWLQFILFSTTSTTTNKNTLQNK